MIMKTLIEAPITSIDDVAKKAKEDKEASRARSLFFNDANLGVLNADSFHRGFDAIIKDNIASTVLDRLFNKNTGLFSGPEVKDTILKTLDSNLGYVKALWKFYWLQFPKVSINTKDIEDNILKAKIETELKAINDAIKKGNVPFSQLTALFNIYKSTDKKMLAKYGKELLVEIWDKIFDTITKTYESLSKIETIQYFYNAYLAENYAKKKLGLEFYNDDHDILFGDYTQAKDDPDFKGLKIFNNSYTVEMKNYKDQKTALAYTSSTSAEIRKKFHHAEFILCYIMLDGSWLLTVNTPKPKEENAVHSLNLGVVPNMVRLSESSVIKVLVAPWELAEKKATKESVDSTMEIYDFWK